jgi:amino acid transporter
VFAMARDRRLPGPLAKVSSRYGTPSGAIALLMAFQALLILGAEADNTLFDLGGGLPHYFSLFVWCSTFGGFALLLVYFLMSVGSLRGLDDSEGRAGLVIASLLGIAITAAAIFGSFYKVTSPTLLAPWFAVIWFVVGLAYMALVKGREPASETLADLRA